MNYDIRLAIGFFEHPKTKKLQRRCGPEGVLCLQRLWLWAAAQRPSGVLSGLDAEEIELAAGWDGENGKLAEALIECRWLDKQDEAFILHGWEEHQSYAIKSEERSKAAKKAAEERWRQERCNAERMRNDAEGMRSACDAHTDAMQTHAEGNAPLPDIKDINNTIVLLSKSSGFDGPEKPHQGELVPQEKNDVNICPQKKILALYAEILPELPQVRELRENIQTQVRARWIEKSREKGFKTEQDGLAYFRAFFEYVSNNAFLMGRASSSDKWRCDYRWLMKAANFDKVTSGYYARWQS